MFTVNSLVITLVVLSIIGATVYYYLQMQTNNNLVVEVEKNTDELNELVAEVQKNEEQENEEQENSIKPFAVEQGDDLPPEDQEEENACVENEKIKANKEMTIVRRMPEPRNPSLYNLGNFSGVPEDIFAENNWEV